MSEAEYRVVMAALRKRYDALLERLTAIEKGDLEIRRYRVRSYEVQGYTMPARWASRFVPTKRGSR